MSSPDPVLPSQVDTVELAVPAETAYVGLVRTVAAGMATRLDLDLDHVEDVRLAVSEACAVVLPAEHPGARLVLRVQVQPDLLVLEVDTDARSSAPAPDSFAWRVLEALADAAESRVSEAGVAIRLEFSRVDTSAEAAG